MRSGRYRNAAKVYQGPWKTIRKRVLERDGHTCQVRLPGCTTTATTVDHIVPVSWGGDWYALDNLRAACAGCNAALSVLARTRKPKSVTPPNVAKPATNDYPGPSREW